MLDQAIHREILVSVLTDIYSNQKISHLLGFKGGTALYLFYQLNRFSVDLDFDLLEKDRGEEVHETLLGILSKHGSLKDQALKHCGSLISISYAEGLHQLKLDVSHREIIANYEVKEFLGLPMLVMSLKDMAANKLIALTDRKKPAARDVFDMFFILQNKIEINETIIKDRTSLTLVEQLEKTINFLEKNFNTNLLEALGELVEKQQKSWVKDKMKQETLMQLRIRLDSLQNSL